MTEDLEKKSFVMTNKQYKHGACLNEYKGVVSICNADISDAGDVYMQWAYPQYNNKPNEKCLPWAIRLGDTPSAITLLKSMIVQLERLNREGEPAPIQPEQSAAPAAGISTPPAGVDTDLPF